MLHVNILQSRTPLGAGSDARISFRGRGAWRRQGAHVIELAFVCPIFLLFVFGILEYGRFVFMRSVFDNAAREGARFAVVHTYDMTDTDVRNQVLAYLSGQASQLDGFNPSTGIEVYAADPGTGLAITGKIWNDAAFGEAIAIRISGNYRPIIGGFLFLPSSIAFQTIAMMRSEAN